MVKCSSYHITEETRYLTDFEQGVRFAKTGKRITKEKVKVAHCWGTIECQECKCEGDRRKCDFYPKNRLPENVAKYEKEHAPKFGKWISVEDDLPPIKQRVLVFARNGSILIDLIMTPRSGWWVSENSVTHWMPLPEPPKEG